MPTFTTYNPASDSVESLVAAIFTGAGGVTLVPGSVTVLSGVPSSAGEPSAISFYDGSISQIGIGAGLLLTTGDPTPPTTNTSGSYGYDTGSGPTDADLQATITNAFSIAGGVNDPAFLEFHINVTDPLANGLRFDVVFASEEYPEYSNSQYVDVAGVYVNGTNYALFGNDPLHPLSALQPNVDAGNFHNNAGGAYAPIEYDGVSVRLQVTAPIHQGDNVIKIAIADTGDSSWDSAIFVSGLQPVNYSGFGLSQQVPLDTLDEMVDLGGNQTYLGNGLHNLLKLISGQDVYDGGGGIDKAIIDYVLTGYDWNGSVLNLFGPAGTSTQLVNVERLEYSGYLLGLDTQPGGNVFGVSALFEAALNSPMIAPSGLGDDLMIGNSFLSQWVAYADGQADIGGDLGDVAQAMLDTYAPDASNETIISLLYQNIFGGPASSDDVASIAGLIGHFPGLDTLGDLFALAALLEPNTAELDEAGVTGSIVLLDPSFF